MLRVWFDPMPTPDMKQRLRDVLDRLAPDLAAAIAQVEHFHELPQEVRVTIIEVLGSELVERGLDRDDELTDYGRELEALLDDLGLADEA